MRYIAGGSRCGIQRKNSQTLARHVGLVFGKPKLTWSWYLQGIKVNKKNFYYFVNSERLNREKVVLLLSGVSDGSNMAGVTQIRLGCSVLSLFQPLLTRSLRSVYSGRVQGVDGVRDKLAV